MYYILDLTNNNFIYKYSQSSKIIHKFTTIDEAKKCINSRLKIYHTIGRPKVYEEYEIIEIIADTISKG